MQGGPHDHVNAALCVALKDAATPEFKQYQIQVCVLLVLWLSVWFCSRRVQVRANARALSEHLIKNGYSICTGGTDNHLVLWDLRPQGVTVMRFSTSKPGLVC